MGRPPRTFSDKEVKQMEDYAFKGCKNATIALLMDIPESTLKRRFGAEIALKRAERALALREKQDKLATDKAQMAMFLGKNELGQIDRQDINLGGNVSISLEREKSGPQEADTGDNSD